MPNTAAVSLSFWQLLNGQIAIDENQSVSFNKIIIPDIQRDYAEGRPDKATTSIRKNLIEYLCSGLINDNNCDLNFIYGVVKPRNSNDRESVFIPVDGQQRLTTLFLLYWYIFAKASADVGDFTMLKKFSYETRVTTANFCSLLCDIHTIPENDKIKEYLEGLRSVTGNIKRDPSVKSMLVVLSEIQAYFNANENIDYMALVQRLKGDQCPIRFLWLNIGGFGEEELYIKMNSRGKALTPFEIIKAKLQNSAALSRICGDDAHQIIEYIGRLNNEYGDLFYSQFGKEDFDSAMLNFFASVVQCDHFSYIAQSVSGKIYRDYFKTSDIIPAKFFNDFIDNPKSQWENDNRVDPEVPIDPEVLNSIVNKSLMKIDFILGKFINLLPAAHLAIRYYNEINDVFMSNRNATLMTYVTQYALFEFLYEFKGIADADIETSYIEWKRFVYNMLKNTVEKFNAEDAGALLCYFNYIVSKIKNACNEQQPLSVETLRKTIANNPDANNNDFGSMINQRALQQLSEERKKYTLILNDNSWESSILGAEGYFTDGQICFLLDERLTGEQAPLNKFDTYLIIAEELFDREKKPRDGISWVKLQRAALCCTDESEDGMAFLEKKGNWKFHTQNVSYKSMLAKSSMLEIFNARRNDPTSDLNTVLDGVATVLYQGREEWKNLFIGDMLQQMNDYNNNDLGNKFSFTIAFRENTVLLLTGDQRTNAPNMEINTFKLYLECNQNEKQLIFATGDSLRDTEGHIKRYVKVNERKIGYYPVDPAHPYIDIDTRIRYSFDDALAKLNQNSAHI